MSGGNWNRASRRSGGNQPVVIPCVAAGAGTADEIVQSLIGRVVEIEAERGIKIDWLAQLPDGRDYSARDLVNAIGRALTAAGIANNLVRSITSEETKA